MLKDLLYLFFIGSILGWCLEAVYRRFCPDNKTRKWVNPGFLVGPYLPLYGFGLCVLYMLAKAEYIINPNSQVLIKLLCLLIMAICMTLLEFIAGMIFIRRMKLKLWDYSDKPFNFKGVICLEFSVYWLILAAVYCFLIHDYMGSLLLHLTSNQAYLFPLGFLSGIFVVDFGYTIQIASKIKRFADEHSILIRYEELKSNIRKTAEEHKEKYSYIFAFHSRLPLNEHLKKYFDNHPKRKK